MQEASAPCITGHIYPPFSRCRDGYRLLPKTGTDFSRSDGGLLWLASSFKNQSGARFALDALLLFAFPLLFTFAKFVALLADSSHQFVR